MPLSPRIWPSPTAVAILSAISDHRRNPAWGLHVTWKLGFQSKDTAGKHTHRGTLRYRQSDTQMYAHVHSWTQWHRYSHTILHIYTQTGQIQTNTYRRIHLSTHANGHRDMDTCICPHMCTKTHKYTHIQTHTQIRQTHQIHTHIPTRACVFRQMHTPTCSYLKTQVHTSPHEHSHYTLSQALALWLTVCGCICVRRSGTIQHGIHPLKAISFPRRQKIDLMILSTIIIFNTTCSNSEEDPDVFAACGCFSEFYIQQLYFNPKDLVGSPQLSLSASNLSIFGEADDSQALPFCPGLRHLPSWRRARLPLYI